MRVAVDWISGSKDNYNLFCKQHPTINLTYDKWRSIIYTFSDLFKEHILETGQKAKLPFGFGDFSINKKKRKKLVVDPEGKEFINLPIDWQKTKEKGKRIYNFNYHTEGYFFGWMWFKTSARLKNCSLWYFKPSRLTSRLITQYIKSNEKYQFLYNKWRA